ncbi:hypothetical protein [Palleronia sp.]|uniref:hypothetical protein n=1 Tax=Palleronia sp. TaxID=1940284 RepID=UPI0035C82AAA
MNIAQVSSRFRLPARTSCYDENADLVHPQRKANGYRRFRRERFLGVIRNNI